jgi:hypothetical protein
MRRVRQGECSRCARTAEVIDVEDCNCESCLREALDAFKETCIVLPDWAIRRVVEGRGYQLRVPVTEQTTRIDGHPDVKFDDVDLDGAVDACLPDVTGLECHAGSERVTLCPIWHRKERFWVQEAFKVHPVNCSDLDDEDHVCDKWCRQTHVYYRSTPRIGYRPNPDQAAMTYLHPTSPLTDFHTTGFREARRMQRRWSRMVLNIRLKRVERIQDISDEEVDILVFPSDPSIDLGESSVKKWDRSTMRAMWDRSHPHDLRYDANPWTWVAETVPCVCGRWVKKATNRRS